MSTPTKRRVLVALVGGVALASIAALAVPAAAQAAQAPKPTITKIDYNGFPSASVNGGAQVTITGSHFTQVKKVTFGGVAGTHVHVISATKLQVDTPKHNAGEVDVHVQTAAGTSATSAKDTFDFQVRTLLAAGNYHTCQILKGSGGVRCWGYNNLGQLGNGSTTTESTTAVRVSNLKNVVSIVAGGWHNCALTAAGDVKCWGNNQDGQLGTGDLTTMDYNTPQNVIGLGKPAVAIGAGYYNSCALLIDNTVKCWGYGQDGELGNGTTVTHTPLPVKVKNLTDAIDIDMGFRNTCATKSNGTEWCWGYNGDHELGDGTTTNSDVPVKVVGVSHAVSTSSLYATTCVLTSKKTVQCWGYNNAGQTGNGTTTPVSHAVTVPGIHGATKAIAGGYHSCAVVQGTVFCWGSNSNGQLGNNSTTSSLTPTGAQGLHNVTGLTLGLYHTVAVTKNDDTFAWGYNGFGQIGDGTTTDRHIPTAVQ